MEAGMSSSALASLAARLEDFSVEVDRNRFSQQVATETEKRLVSELRSTRALLQEAATAARAGAATSDDTAKFLRAEVHRLAHSMDVISTAHATAERKWETEKASLTKTVASLKASLVAAGEGTSAAANATAAARQLEKDAKAEAAAAAVLRRRLAKEETASAQLAAELACVQEDLHKARAAAAVLKEQAATADSTGKHVQQLKAQVQRLQAIVFQTQREAAVANTKAVAAASAPPSPPSPSPTKEAYVAATAELEAAAAREASLIASVETVSKDLSSSAEEVTRLKAAAVSLEEVQEELLSLVASQSNELAALKAAKPRSPPRPDVAASVLALDARVSELTAALHPLAALKADLERADAAVAAAPDDNWGGLLADLLPQAARRAQDLAQRATPTAGGAADDDARAAARERQEHVKALEAQAERVQVLEDHLTRLRAQHMAAVEATGEERQAVVVSLHSQIEAIQLERQQEADMYAQEAEGLRARLRTQSATLEEERAKLRQALMKVSEVTTERDKFASLATDARMDAIRRGSPSPGAGDGEH